MCSTQVGACTLCATRLIRLTRLDDFQLKTTQYDPRLRWKPVGASPICGIPRRTLWCSSMYNITQEFTSAVGRPQYKEGAVVGVDVTGCFGFKEPRSD